MKLLFNSVLINRFKLVLPVLILNAAYISVYQVSNQLQFSDNYVIDFLVAFPFLLIVNGIIAFALFLISWIFTRNWNFANFMKAYVLWSFINLVILIYSLFN